MFHVMLVLPVLVLMAVLAAIFLFSVFTVAVSVIGGASTAIFVKDKTVRRLLFIAFCILSLVGLICLLPFITLYAQLSELFLTLMAVATCIGIGILAFAGIRCSAAVKNPFGKTVLTVVFGLILAASAFSAVIIPVLRGVLLAAK